MQRLSGLKEIHLHMIVQIRQLSPQSQAQLEDDQPLKLLTQQAPCELSQLRARALNVLLDIAWRLRIRNRPHSSAPLVLLNSWTSFSELQEFQERSRGQEPRRQGAARWSQEHKGSAAPRPPACLACQGKAAQPQDFCACAGLPHSALRCNIN